MAGEIVYADLSHPGDGSSPAEKRHSPKKPNVSQRTLMESKAAEIVSGIPVETRSAPALCPRWHGVLLKVSGLGHLVLLVLVLVLGMQVFQGSPPPAMTSVPRQGSETRGRNQTERCPISSLMRYFCEPRRESPAACAGCKLCPQDWQLHGDRCYWLSKEEGNWTQGKKGCENQKSQLAVLQDKKEMRDFGSKVTSISQEYIKNVTGGSQQPVWIGLTWFHKKWRWVNGTPLNTKIFGRLQEMDAGCGALKDEALENGICDEEHKWVCQKDPFQLSPPTAGDGEKCDASTPERPSPRDAGRQDLG